MDPSGQELRQVLPSMSGEADPIDQATDEQLWAESRQVALIRKEADKPIPTSDSCYECGEDTIDGARWCDAHCRDLWQQKHG